MRWSDPVPQIGATAVTHTVRYWMSQPGVRVHPKIIMAYAMTLMRRRGIRLHRVADEHGVAVGMISTTDIFNGHGSGQLGR